MLDAKALLERFLRAGNPVAPPRPGQGGPVAPSPWGAQPPATTGGGAPGGLPINLPPGVAEAARGMLGRVAGGGGGGGFSPGSFAGGAAAGGVLGLLLGGKKGKKLRKLAGGGGGLLSHGAAAALGALAHRAYTQYQAGRPPAPPPPTVAAPSAWTTPPAPEAVEPRFLPSAAPAADGRPFELALVRAMVAAAKADGHVDAEEQRRILEAVERLDLDAEAKGFVLDALVSTPDVAAIAASARTPEQAAELWLAARLAVDPDDPRERAWLDDLARRLSLPEGLAAHLDAQARAALAEAAAS